MTDLTSPKSFVFVLMPFSEDFDDIYKVGIKAACQEAGAYCERVDEQIYTENILERIYNQIAKADIIVSDMSKRNPNVFYETGYAHALGKQVILLTQNADDIPFDMKHYPHIIYKNSISSLKNELKRRVEWCIQNPRSSLSKVDYQLEIFAGGKQIIDGLNLKVKNFAFMANYYRLFRLPIDIHNISKTVCEPSSVQIGFIAKWLRLDPQKVKSRAAKENKNVTIPAEDRVITMPDGKSMQIYKLNDRLLPNGWATLTEVVAVHQDNNPLACNLKVLTETGEKNINFTLEFINE